jgi:hypothetical protein
MQSHRALNVARLADALDEEQSVHRLFAIVV